MEKVELTLPNRLNVKTYSFKPLARNPKNIHLMPVKKQQKYVSEETTHFQMRKLATTKEKNPMNFAFSFILSDLGLHGNS